MAAMATYPELLVPPGGVAPVPRRVRGLLGSSYVFDTRQATYVWEFPPYPHYYIPLADVDTELLVEEGRTEPTPRGIAAIWGLRAADLRHPGAVQILGDDAPEPLRQTVRFDWPALDWFEEDERVFVHARNPYSRVDAVHADVAVRIELDGVVLAEAPSVVRVFETGLPPRHYLAASSLRLEHLVASETVTSCPYKGTTSRYWSVQVRDVLHPDLAWEYAFPTAPLLAIANRVAFYDERVDTFLDGERLQRPVTPFS